MPAWRSKRKQRWRWPDLWGVTLQDRGVQDPSELETVFVAVSKDRPDALLALIDLSLSSHRERILEFSS